MIKETIQNNSTMLRKQEILIKILFVSIVILLSFVIVIAMELKQTNRRLSRMQEYLHSIDDKIGNIEEVVTGNMGRLNFHEESSNMQTLPSLVKTMCRENKGICGIENKENLI